MNTMIIIITVIAIVVAILWNADIYQKRIKQLVLNNAQLDAATREAKEVVASVDRHAVDEQVLKENAQRAEKFQQLFENAPAGLMLADGEGLLEKANSTLLNMYQHIEQNKQGYRFNVVFPADPFRGKITPDEFVEPLYVCEISDEVEDLKLHYLEKSYIPIMGESGKREMIYCEVRDLTDERNMLMELSKTEKESQAAIKRVKMMENALETLFADRGIYLNYTDYKKRTLTYYVNPAQPVVTLTFDDMLKLLKDTGIDIQDLTEAEVKERFCKPYTATFKLPDIFNHQDDYLHVFTQRTIPVFNKDGVQTGAYGVIMDTTEITEKREKLKREHANAEHSTKQKSFFLASMTHEIRTPLNAIVGFTQILDSIETAEERKDILDIITQSCDVMLRLINDILEVSSNHDTLTINPKMQDFPVAFQKICETLAQVVTEPNVEFMVDSPMGHLPLPLDIDRIQQVISNFVNNAVKYTTEGHIKVGYSYHYKKGLHVYCEDTGTGIPADKKDSVFEQFVKLNEHVQGTGLGLNICKRIVEKCDGQIGVDSELGKGSTFWFDIPQRYFDIATDEVSDAQNATLMQMRKKIINDDTHVQFLVDQHVKVQASNYSTIYPDQPLSKEPLVGNILHCKNAIETGHCGTAETCKACPLRGQINQTFKTQRGAKGVKASLQYYLNNSQVVQKPVNVDVEYMELDSKPYAVVSFHDPWR